MREIRYSFIFQENNKISLERATIKDRGTPPEPRGGAENHESTECGHSIRSPAKQPTPSSKRQVIK